MMNRTDYVTDGNKVPRLSEKSKKMFETRQQYRARMRALAKEAKKGLKT